MRAYGAKSSDRQAYKIRRHLLRANLPNLMLAKFSRYTIYGQNVYMNINFAKFCILL